MVFNQRILILDDGTKLWFPADEEFDEFFTNEDEYENDDEYDEYKEEYEEDDYYDFEMSDEEAEEVLGSVPVFEKGVHDHGIDEENACSICNMLGCWEDPELVCLTLSLMTCSFLRWKAINVGFVVSNLKTAICEIYKLDEEEFCENWGRGRVRELVNSVSDLIYNLRYKLIRCDNDEIDYLLVNKDGGEFAYTLFANIFANKVFNPYDTNSFDFGNPRSVDYRSLVELQ